MKSRFIYWLVYSGMWLFSALPFRILYLLSDFNYLLMYRIGRYRRKVVRENLKKSFPEKDKKERTVIHVEVNEKHYYFGSLAAIYEVFDSKTLGIGYGISG